MKMAWNCIALFFVLVFVGNLQAQDSKQDSIRNLNRHDFLQQGDGVGEIETGDYVIVATAMDEEDSKLAVKEFKKLKYPEPNYAYASKRSIWYIYYGPFEDIEHAKSKRDEYKKFQLCRNAYLLTVYTPEKR